MTASGNGNIFAFQISNQGTGNISVTQSAAINLSGTAGGGALGTVTHSGATGNITVNLNGSFTGGGSSAQGLQIGFTNAASTGVGSFTLSNNSTLNAGNFALQIAHSGAGGGAAETHQVAVTAGSQILAGTVAASTAVEIQGTGQSLNLTNGGTISSILGTGIAVDSGFITGTNTGTITGTSGVTAGLAGSNFVNAGTINGTGGTAITFIGTGNTLTLQNGTNITGTVQGGTNATFQLGGTTGTPSFNVATLGVQYLNFSTFNKIDTGVWTLTGTNATVMPWAVAAGTLNVNATMANSAFTVNGGTLGGTGTIANTQINAGGTFAPGSGAPASSMTVNGSLTLVSSAFYMVQINPATSSQANVSGTATPGGATVNAVFAPGSYIAKQYTIMTAGSIAGIFNATVANTNLPSGFSSALSYDLTHAYLNLTLNPGGGGGGGGSLSGASGLNGNQQKVANALINFFNTTGGIPAVFGSLTAFGLTQASGETATGSQQTTFNAMTQFMGLITDPFIAGRSGGAAGGGGATPFAAESDSASAYAANGRPRSGSERDAYAAVYNKAPPVAPFEQRWSVWAAGFGGSQTTDGNAVAGSNNTSSSVYGAAVGADYRFSPSTPAGFALAGGGTSFLIGNGLGSGRSDLFQAGAYLRHNEGPAYISAALAYGWQDITTNRTVTIAGVDQLRAEFNANAYSGRVEGGYRFGTPWMGVTPYAAGQFTTFDLPAYAERAIVGTNNFALTYGAKSVTDPRSELGIRTDKSWAMPDSILTLRGRFAWAHDYNTDRSIGATFQTLPGASFVVNGAAQGADKALTTASAEVRWMNGISLVGTFEGEFSQNSQSYAGKGVVRYQW